MNRLTQSLIKQLEKKGMDPDMILGFIRRLENMYLADPHMGFLEVNNRLHFLGWYDFELDYHTFQLAVACFEDEILKSLENKSAD